MPHFMCTEWHRSALEAWPIPPAPLLLIPAAMPSIPCGLKGLTLLLVVRTWPNDRQLQCLALLWKLASAEEEETVQGHVPVSRGCMALTTCSYRDIKDQMFGPLVLNGDNSEGPSQPQCLLENCLRPCEDQIISLPNSASFSSNRW